MSKYIFGGDYSNEGYDYCKRHDCSFKGYDSCPFCKKTIIEKYPLNFNVHLIFIPWKETDIEIEIPKGSRILSAMGEGSRIVVYAEINPIESLEYRTIAIFGTGKEIDRGNKRFINTVVVQDRVFHVFEILKEEEK